MHKEEIDIQTTVRRHGQQKQQQLTPGSDYRINTEQNAYYLFSFITQSIHDNIDKKYDTLVTIPSRFFGP